MNENIQNQTVEQLRKSGNKVRVHHYRHIREGDNGLTRFVPLCDIQNFTKVHPKGGLTKVSITTPEGKHFEGKAGCVMTDAFNYKLGVRIALGKLQEVQNP